MPNVTRIIFALLAGTVAAQAAPLPLPASFRPDDRWVAIGDSITHNGAYARYVELFYVTRFPSAAIAYTNAGISGDTLSGALRRFDWDVAPAQPTVTTVLMGMNDVGRQNYRAEPADADLLRRRQVSLTDYENNLRTLVSRLLTLGSRVIIVSPTPYDDTAALDSGTNHVGANAALARIGEIGAAVAAETGVAFIDLHTPLTALNHRLQADNPAFTLISGDRVHPGAPGHFAAAFHFLKAQGVSGDVTRIQIDAARRTATRTESSRVSDLAISDTSVAFTYTADSLPLFIPPEATPALAWIPFQSELNREELRFTGLAPGAWQLAIDGEAITLLDSAALAEGFNLADFATPQRAQARRVFDLLQKRWELLGRLRLIAAIEHQHAGNLPRPLTVAALAPAIDAWALKLAAESPTHWQRKHPEQYREWKPAENELRAEAEILLRQARAAAAPLPRKITLTRVVD